MTITLYYSKAGPEVAAFVKAGQALLDELAAQAHGKLKVASSEVKTTEQKQRAKELGLQEIAFGDGGDSADRVAIGQGFLGLVFEYRTEREVIPVLDPNQTKALEFWIGNKAREIRARGDDEFLAVGVVRKPGMSLSDPHLVPPQEGKPGPTLRSILEQALPFYRLTDVVLDDGRTAIDPKLRGLVVLQAEVDWSDRELARIDEFLMRGDRGLTVIAGAVNLAAHDPSMKATLDTHRIDRLLGGYGIELQRAALFDADHRVRVPVSMAGGQEKWLIAPGVVALQFDPKAAEAAQRLDNAFAGFFRLDELAFPFPSPLKVEPSKQPEATFRIVARSSPKATLHSDVRQALDLRPQMAWTASGPPGQHALAVVVEGVLQSAFGASGPEGITLPARSPSSSRVLVVASPQLLVNPFARAGNPPVATGTPPPPSGKGDAALQALAFPYARRYLTGTILAFKNMLDWMATDDEMQICASLLLTSTQ